MAEPASRRPFPVDLETATIDELRGHLEAGSLTSLELTDAYLNRIEAFDRHGPSLHAIRAVAPDARDQAAAADRARAQGSGGHLLGIPVLIKDNIDVAGMPTTAGSLAMRSSYPSGDADLVARLRAAGAVILGKTNLTEFANFMSSHMPSGYSSLGGQVLNPYDVRLDPSGSSAGSPAAVVVGFAAVAVGTETSGSILSPCEAQSAVGIKPTVGLVGLAGVIPVSHTQDVAGPIARTVADAAAALSAMVGPEADQRGGGGGVGPGDPACLRADALFGARLGVVTSFDTELVPDQQFLWRAAQDSLASRGAHLVPVALPCPVRPLGVLVYEFRDDIDGYLNRLPAAAPVRSLAEIIAFNQAHAGAALKFGQDRLVTSQAVDIEGERKGYEAERADDLVHTKDRIDELLVGSGLDALVFPGVTGYDVGARAGYPSVTVPAGYWPSTRQPFGIQFLTTAFADNTVIGFAYDYEQATQLRRPPSHINPSLFGEPIT